jgi:hypothetical protein
MSNDTTTRIPRWLPYIWPLAPFSPYLIYVFNWRAWDAANSVQMALFGWTLFIAFLPIATVWCAIGVGASIRMRKVDRFAPLPLLLNCFGVMLGLTLNFAMWSGPRFHL